MKLKTDYTYCIKEDCIHRYGCGRWIGNYGTQCVDGKISLIDGTSCDDKNSCDQFHLLDRFRYSDGMEMKKDKK